MYNHQAPKYSYSHVIILAAQITLVRTGRTNIYLIDCMNLVNRISAKCYTRLIFYNKFQIRSDMEEEAAMSKVSATIPWLEGTEEDFKELREGLERMRQMGITPGLGDTDSEEDSEDDSVYKTEWFCQYEARKRLLDSIKRCITTDLTAS